MTQHTPSLLTPAAPAADAVCPCGSGASLAHCCSPRLTGSAPAPTPEALMRSRYTAHVLGDIDYLLATWAPEIRPRIDPDSVRRWATGSTWQGLTVLASGSKGERGQVEFSARYTPAGGTPQVHHERSYFRREQGRWYFVDGVTPTAPGRNSLCPCGSGKKFKRCCT